jgi:acyl carrier protein
MDLLQIVRNIQYQIAKIEVIELLYWHNKNNNPGLDAEIIHNLFATVRQNLFDNSEACLTANPEALAFCIDSLRNSIITTNKVLFQTNSNLNASDIRVIFLKDLLNKIAEELINSNAALSQLDLQPVEENITEILSYIDDSSYIDEPEITYFELDETVEDIDTSIDEVLEDESIDSATEETPKKLDLIPLDVNQIVETNDLAINEVAESESRFELLVYQCNNSQVDAEFWIESEQKHNPNLNRDEAIESAIKITDCLGDNAHVFTLVQKCISEYLEIEVDRVNLDEPIGGKEGVEQLDYLELVMALEEQFNIEISDEMIDQFIVVKHRYSSRYRPYQLPSYDPKNIELFHILCTGRALLDFMYKQLKELSAEAN